MSELNAGVYRHYKGGHYLALGVAYHSESNERLVAYVPLDVEEAPRIIVRPFNMFFDVVEVKDEQHPRFEYLGETESESIVKQYDYLIGYTVIKFLND